MTQITNDHVEWAVVGRLRRMIEESPHREFNVTQAYALFTTTLCWVMQRIRIPQDQIKSAADESAYNFLRNISNVEITATPWCISLVERIEVVGNRRISIPAPVNFQNHTLDRLLINLRDATAHGDARNVEPFNIAVGAEQPLVGFRFRCAERKKPWNGEIILLESDLRRLGAKLAKGYCDALRHSETHRRDSDFGRYAASVKEAKEAAA